MTTYPSINASSDLSYELQYRLSGPKIPDSDKIWQCSCGSVWSS